MSLWLTFYVYSLLFFLLYCSCLFSDSFLLILVSPLPSVSVISAHLYLWSHLFVFLTLFCIHLSPLSSRLTILVYIQRLTYLHTPSPRHVGRRHVSRYPKKHDNKIFKSLLTFIWPPVLYPMSRPLYGLTHIHTYAYIHILRINHTYVHIYMHVLSCESNPLFQTNHDSVVVRKMLAVLSIFYQPNLLG